MASENLLEDIETHSENKSTEKVEDEIKGEAKEIIENKISKIYFNLEKLLNNQNENEQRIKNILNNLSIEEEKELLKGMNSMKFNNYAFDHLVILYNDYTEYFRIDSKDLIDILGDMSYIFIDNYKGRKEEIFNYIFKTYENLGKLHILGDMINEQEYFYEDLDKYLGEKKDEYVGKIVVELKKNNDKYKVVDVNSFLKLMYPETK